MVSARVAEVILRDERAVFPAGSYNARFGTTVSLPSIVGRQGVLEVLEPAMFDEETQGLERSAARLKETVRQYIGVEVRSFQPRPVFQYARYPLSTPAFGNDSKAAGRRVRAGDQVAALPHQGIDASYLQDSSKQPLSD